MPLGWRPIARPNNIGRPAAWLEIAPGQELHLVEVPGFEPSPFEAEFGRHMEGQIALATLLRRAPRLRLAVEPRALRWRPGLVLRGLEGLPVVLAGDRLD